MLYHTNSNTDVKSVHGGEHLNHKDLRVKYYIYDTLVFLYVIVCLLIISSCAYVAFGIEKFEDDIKNSHITSMSFFNDADLVDIKFLKNFPNLRELDLSWTSVGDNYKDLACLKKLEKLNLIGCHIETAAYLKNIPSLKYLKISAPSTMGEIVDDLKQIPTLEGLTITGDVKGIERLGEIATLHRLNLKGIFNASSEDDVFPSLNFLTSLNLLRDLDLSHSEEIFSVYPLSKMLSLETINLSSCCNLSNLKSLSSLVNLRVLDVSHITEFHNKTLREDIALLRGLPKLESLLTSLK